MAILSLLLLLFACSSQPKALPKQQPRRFTNPNPYNQPYPYGGVPSSRGRDGYYYRSPTPYGYGSPPRSSYYNNPYSFPPQNYYPYYDGDHHYVPPTYYGGANDERNVMTDHSMEKF